MDVILWVDSESWINGGSLLLEGLQKRHIQVSVMDTPLVSPVDFLIVDDSYSGQYTEWAREILVVETLGKLRLDHDKIKRFNHWFHIFEYISRIQIQRNGRLILE